MHENLRDKIKVVNSEIGQQAYIGSEVESVMEYVENNGIKGVIVSFDYGYRGSNLDFLKNYPFLETITIQYYGDIDISAIHYLNNLKKIAINIITNDTQLIDFTCFPILDTCFFDWRPKAKSIFQCTTLRDLRISKFKKDDLANLQELTNLESLLISSSPIKSLKGIENLKLSSLKLNYLTKLDSLTYIEGLANSLQELDIHACKKINSIESISFLKRLDKLGVNNCGEISSIKPIKNLKKLDRFNFWETTNILDGDMTPCLNIKKVAFQNRKHYTHSWEEIKKLTKK